MRKKDKDKKTGDTPHIIRRKTLSLVSLQKIALTLFLSISALLLLVLVFSGQQTSEISKPKSEATLENNIFKDYQHEALLDDVFDGIKDSEEMAEDEKSAEQNIPILEEDPNPFSARRRDRRYDLYSCRTLSIIESLDCFLKLAVDEVDVNICLNLEDNLLRDVCVRHYSIEHPEGCRFYENHTSEAFMCYIEASQFRFDISLCDFLHEGDDNPLRSFCMHNYLMPLGRLVEGWPESLDERMALAQNIPHRDLRLYTRAVLEDDAILCETLPEKDPLFYINIRKVCLECVEETSKRCLVYSFTPSSK
jgi:hypothetical protein